MKRCPQCSFLYLDSDQLCDLDQTPLVADAYGTDVGVIEHSEQKAAKPSPTPAEYQRKVNLKSVSAAIVAGLIIGLMLLLSYQRMLLRASQTPPTSQAHASPSHTSLAQAAQAARVSQVAQQASNQVSTSGSLAQQESAPSASPDNTAPLAEPSASTTAKTTPNTRPDSARLRVSSNPVSTGDVKKSGHGPVTIRLTDGSTLQADEVWRTKAGIWYRRKGIVTLLKPNRVRSTND